MIRSMNKDSKLQRKGLEPNVELGVVEEEDEGLEVTLLENSDLATAVFRRKIVKIP